LIVGAQRPGERDLRCAGALTFTVAVAVLVPPAPVAVSVYVVVEDGFTMNDSANGWPPMALSMETTVAFVVVHVSVADCRVVMEVGAEGD
jgi:hypothetical protein